MHSDCCILGRRASRSQDAFSHARGVKMKGGRKEDRGEASTELHKLCRSSTETSQTESATTHQWPASQPCSFVTATHRPHNPQERGVRGGERRGMRPAARPAWGRTQRHRVAQGSSGGHGDRKARGPCPGTRQGAERTEKLVRGPQPRPPPRHNVTVPC